MNRSKKILLVLCLLVPRIGVSAAPKWDMWLPLSFATWSLALATMATSAEQMIELSSQLKGLPARSMLFNGCRIWTQFAIIVSTVGAAIWIQRHLNEAPSK